MSVNIYKYTVDHGKKHVYQQAYRVNLSESCSQLYIRDMAIVTMFRG